MRLATFNLLHGLPVLGASRASMDGQVRNGPPAFDRRLMETALRRLDADVLGLQEVDVHQPRSDHVDQVAIAREAMRADASIYVPTVLGTPGEDGWRGAPEAMTVAHGVPSSSTPREEASAPSTYGVALISRYPVSQWEVVRFAASRGSMPLLVPGDPRPQWVKVDDEPRAAIAAVVDGPLGEMTVITAHLSFVPGVNVAQLRSLRAAIAHLPQPIVLLGDLNLPGRIPARVSGWRSLAHGATYPSMRPSIQFDHALAHGLPDDVRSVATVHRLPVSDHLALTVDLG